MLADEEADHRHVGLGDAHGAELRMLGLACNLDGTIEEQRLIGLQAHRLEGVEGEIGAVGRDHDVVEPAYGTLHAGLRRTMLVPLSVITSSPFWLMARHCSWTIPISGRLLDGTLPAHSTQALSVSP